MKMTELERANLVGRLSLETNAGRIERGNRILQNNGCCDICGQSLGPTLIKMYISAHWHCVCESTLGKDTK
jgi:hypothetical protein